MFNLRNSNPSIALKFGAVFQTTRLLGSEIGYALMQTWIRVRQQFHAEMLGGNVVDGSVLAVGQLQDYAAAVAGRSTGTG
jgi:DHA2 family multidrug resistance protein